MASAPRASAATSSSDAPPRAATAAATVPSTSGASLISTRPPRLQHLDRELGAHERAAEVHQHEHAVVGHRALDRRAHALGVGAQRARARPSRRPPRARAPRRPSRAPTRRRPRRAPRCGRRRRARPLRVPRVRRPGAGGRSGAPPGARWPWRSASGTSRCRSHRRRARGAHLVEEVGADRHRDVVLLGLQPVRAGDAAAARVHLGHLQARGSAPAARAPACRSSGPAAGTARGRRSCPARAGSRSSARRGRGARAAARRCRRCARLTSSRSGSSSRSRISRASRLSISVQLVALPTMIVSLVAHVRRQVARQAQHDLARVVEQAAGLQRQPAAVLLGDLDLEAVVLEDRDELLALLAARSTRCRSRGSRRPCARSPGSACLRAQREKRRPAKSGAGASRWTFSSFSPRIRSGRCVDRPVGDLAPPGCPRARATSGA